MRNCQGLCGSNFLAFAPPSAAYGRAVKKPFVIRAGRGVLALATDLAMLALFAGACLLLALYPSPASNWVAAAHVVASVVLLIAVSRHVLGGRPPMFWSHLDFMVFLLFAAIVASVYYSEVRPVSWRTAAMCMDGLVAFLIGRYAFYRRVRFFVIVMLVTCVAVYLSSGIALERLQQAEAFDALYGLRLEQARRVALLAGVFFVVALPFLGLHKPANIVFFAWGVTMLGLYALLISRELVGVIQQATGGDSVEFRHGRLLVTETTARIFATFPLAGCGLGTLPLLFEAYKPLPYLPNSASLGAYTQFLVEAGAIGLFLLLYVWMRVPVFIFRRWGLFPNRRLRMAVVVFFTFAAGVFLQGFHNSDILNPWSWFALWGCLGTLMSLVMVRDPIRVFGHPPSARPLGGPVTSRSAAMLRDTVHAVLRTDFQPLSPEEIEAKRLNPAKFLRIGAVAVVIGGLLWLQCLPYIAGKMARRLPNEEISSLSYGMRLERAVRLYPLLADGWSRLAHHYQQLAATNPLDLYKYPPRAEAAHLQAIRLNPYEPRNYEQLAFFYNDTNNQTRSLETLKDGVRNNPNHFVLRLLLVRELEKAGSLALATWHVKQALFRIAPEQVELYIRLGELYERRGMRDTALRYYQYASQVVPETAQTSMRLRRLRDRLQGIRAGA